MDLREAEERFRQLEMQRRARAISDEQYRAALNGLRVTDTMGRLWMPQELTGQWHVYDGARWLPATPPIAPTPPAPAPGPAASAAQGPAVSQEGGCGRIVVYLAIWGVFWIVVAVAAFMWKGSEEPLIVAGVGLAALLSLVFMLPMLLSRWQGQIVELRTERVKVQDDDDWKWEDQVFAYVRQPSGRVRRLRAMPDWKVGDRLVKRQGDAVIHKV